MWPIPVRKRWRIFILALPKLLLELAKREDDHLPGENTSTLRLAPPVPY